jgi:hypothetical protein
MTTVGGEREAGESGSGIVPIWLSHLAGLSWRLVVVAALGLALFLLAAQLFIATASVVLAAIVAATFARGCWPCVDAAGRAPARPRWSPSGR